MSDFDNSTDFERYPKIIRPEARTTVGKDEGPVRYWVLARDPDSPEGGSASAHQGGDETVQGVFS